MIAQLDQHEHRPAVTNEHGQLVAGAGRGGVVGSAAVAHDLLG